MANQTGVSNLYKVGETYYAYICREGTRHRQSLKTKNLEAAKEKLEFLLAKSAKLHEFDFSRLISGYTPDKLTARSILAGVKDRSRTKGVPCSLTAHEVDLLLSRSGGFCELTGIEFTKDKSTGIRRAAFAPSIDRIDASKPYSMKNCRIVCVAVNIALADWGEAVFKEICKGYCKSHELL